LTAVLLAARPAHPDPEGRYLPGLLGRPLTAEQLAAATAPLQPQLIVAGAGSGKTTVMAARVVHAVAAHGLPPTAVLGLTFTTKAAAELGERIGAALRSLESAAAQELPTVATYHSYAAGLVAEHAIRVGREPDARLLTEAGRWQLAARVVRAARGPYPHLPWRARHVVGLVLALDAELSEQLCSVEQARAVDRHLLAEIDAVDRPRAGVRRARAAALAREELLDLVAAFRQRKADLDFIDFGDQVALAAEIAGRCPEVGQAERDRYALVLLDEYQDTGVAQRRLLTGLFGPGWPVTAVGDPCQSIYGWRGASAGNLARFAEHFGVPTGLPPYPLRTNFRSGGRLLAVANAVSAPLRREGNPAGRPGPAVAGLVPAPGAADAGEVRCALLPTAQDEADWVAGQVAGAVAGGVPPGEVAVLCRRRADFRPLFAALADHGLPVEVVGLGGLLDMPEVADVVATLQVLAEPTANAALVRLLTGPRWALGPRDLAALGRRARDLAGPAAAAAGEPGAVRGPRSADPAETVSLLDALESPGDPTRYSPAAHHRLRLLAGELAALREVVARPVVEAVHQVASTIGVVAEVAAGPVALASARSANLAAFTDHAARFVGLTGESDVRSFLDWLAAAADAQDGLDVGGVSAADTVKLLTVHQAKGLEWDVVAVPALVADIFPSDRSRGRWISAAEALPYRLRGDRDDLPADPDWSTRGLGAFDTAAREDDAAEERRLAYVAVTRARRLLLVSGHRWSPTRKAPCDPSPYLTEMRDLLRAAGQEEQVWTDDPGPANPLLERTVEVDWPAPADPLGLAARVEAAELVRAALANGLPPAPAAAVADPVLSELAGQVELLLAELDAGRAPDRPVALPRTITTSQLVALREDPQRFAGQLRRPVPRRPGAAARRGTRFHDWVQARAGGGSLPLFEPDDLPGAADADLPPDTDLAGLQRAFERSPYGGRRPVAAEQAFELVLGGQVLRGRIDAVYRTEDDPRTAPPGVDWDVIDYKTGRPGGGRGAAELQLAVYRLAWADLAGVPPERVRAGFLHLDDSGAPGRPHWPELPDREDLRRLLGAPARGPAAGSPRGRAG